MSKDREWSSRFAKSAAALREAGPAEDVHPALHKAQIDAAESMATELSENADHCAEHGHCCCGSAFCCDCGEEMA
ncbi:MAG: hypothetical protein V4661_15545 [Pseudomonadota bacterium]